jgi:hypothetical protein
MALVLSPSTSVRTGLSKHEKITRPGVETPARCSLLNQIVNHF